VKLTHLSLFSGIGGIDLAAEWAGFESVGQCEWADYPTKILEKHWPDVPRWRDIRDVTKESFSERTGLGAVDLISGGFPCQPFSVAGKREGSNDDRFLWPEMFRVISEIRPTWVVGENVPGIVKMALEQVLANMESIGYQCQTFIIPAVGVDAPHKRDRVFIVANSDCARCEECNTSTVTAQQRQHTGLSVTHDVSNANNGCWLVRGNRELSAAPPISAGGRNHGGRTSEYVAGKWWPPEPGVCRVVNGVPARVDRLKCLGNAVVPQQIYPILNGIAEIMRYRVK
jgi:DNA (cytosine-5)-methyltransferase 1